MHTISVLLFWKPALEIAILWIIIYHILLFFEGTRAVQVLRGVVVLLVMFFLFQRLNLQALDWLLTKLFGISVIAFLIIFHPEVRQGLARLGQRRIFATNLREEELDYMVKELVKGIECLINDKFGALIAIEKNDSLVAYTESGIAVDARVSSELIQAIFTPNNPLHDGAVIIQQGRILSAGCLFPLSAVHDISRIFGTRHRAALGLSEETDAVMIIVSEERRDVSLVYKARMYRDLSREDLTEKIKELLRKSKENG
jgi:diadenylate cyclase